MRSLLAFFLICALAPDAGAQWTKLDLFPSGTVESIITNDSDLFVCETGGIFHSTDNGQSWSGIDTAETDTATDYSLFSMVQLGKSLFAASGGVFRFIRTDTGWTASLFSRPGRFIVYSIVLEGTNLFAGTNHGIFLSTDSGNSWDSLSNGYNGSATELGVFDSEIFATTGSGVYRSTDSGASWRSVNRGLGKDSNFVWAYGAFGIDFFAGSEGDVFQFNDSSWIKLDSNLFTYAYIRDFLPSGSELFAGTDGSGVLLSRDSGASWSEINNGLTDTSIGAIAANSTYLFAGDYEGGLWRIPLSDLNLSGVALQSGTSDGSLMQVFPNPATNSITIESPTGPVSVFDPLGRKCTVPTRDNMLDVSGFPSGVYFVTDGVSHVRFVKE
jgi:photosystem II stability/assembly factor-like uncharacterized protein